MKNLLFIRKQILGVALLAVLSGAPLMTATAHAAPNPNPRASQNNDRRNRDDRDYNNRDYNDDRRDNNRDTGNDGRDSSFTGVVTNVRAGNRFDARAGNRTYTVTTDSSLPRALSVGDTVRVSGQIYGGNDVRRADVSIINNDRDGNRDNNWNDNRGDRNDNSPRNYRGTVEILLPGNEFNARIDGRIYKIYALESTRDLRVGDPITIYGQMDRGVNIRSARVTVENYRGSGRDNQYDYRNPDDNYRDNNRDDNWRDSNRDNNWRPGDTNNQRDFDTYFGEVTDVKNSREFDVRVDGRTYNVYADNSIKRLSRGDTVRIYGKRTGSNDIRGAKVNITRNR